MISELHLLYISSCELFNFLYKKKEVFLNKCLGNFKIQMGLKKRCSPHLGHHHPKKHWYQVCGDEGLLEARKCSDSAHIV